MGEVILSMMYSVGDKIGQLMLAEKPDQDLYQRLVDSTAVYTEAVERVLGAQAGSINLIEPAVLDEWVDALQSRKTCYKESRGRTLKIYRIT
jgi:hypothetical protein